MKTRPLRILLVCEAENDADAVRNAIDRIGAEWGKLDWVSSFEAGRQAFAEDHHDVYLLHDRLGAQRGTELLAEARTIGCAKPVILLSDAVDEDTSEPSNHADASDWLDPAGLSPQLLKRSVQYAIERARSTEALRESDERFRRMADAAPVLIWSSDPDGNCTFFNARWLAFTGRSAQQESGRGWQTGIHPGERDRVLEIFDTALGERREFSVEHRLRRSDGTFRWLLNTGLPRYGSEGTFGGYVGSCVDITERRKAETGLAEAQNYARSLIDSSVDMIVSVDTDRRVVEFNRAAEEIFGYAKEEIIGRHVDVLYDDPGVGVYVYDAILKSGRFSGEVLNRCKDGRVFPTYLSASLLSDAAGNVVGVMGISRDITESKSARKQLEKTLSEIETSRQDLLSILNELRLGVVMTGADGRVTFLSRICQQLLRKTPDEVTGMHWEQVCPFTDAVKDQLNEMMSLPTHQRRKVPAQLAVSGGPQSWVEIETKDDPRDSKRKIFLLYDITEVQDLRRMLDQRAHFQDMVGKSERMQRVYQQIRDLGSVDSTVLIEGETGTGKELVARAVHATGRRKGKPFLAVNCAGLTDSLLSSQLFGHRRGAFTGAIENQMGVFETATGGTVFLDEIGDISRNVQTSLLRVLQEKEITRVGEATPHSVDVRIIVATHQDLNRAVEEGRFRLDLLYRIRVARIQLPALRDRREDIPLLAETFLNRSRATTGKRVEEIGEEAMGLLLDHAWPGNVRELQSAIEFAVLRCTGSVIRPSDLPPEIGPAESLSAIDGGDERSRIELALKTAKGNRLLAARLLGVSRSTLYRRLSDFQNSAAES